MSFLKNLLLKQRYPVLLLLIGAGFIFLANYSIAGKWNSLDIQSKTSPGMVLFIFGILLVLVSAGLFIFDADDINIFSRIKLQNTDRGFATIFRDNGQKLCVDFGSITDIDPVVLSKGTVVLPVNDFFDKRCFNDVRTVTGSFIKKHLNADQVKTLEELIVTGLKDYHFEFLKGASLEEEKSYGVGTCIYIEKLPGPSCDIILAAMATDREKFGLRTEMLSIFTVAKELVCIVTAQRLEPVYIPLLGAGKGGIPIELAFRGLLIALLEAKGRENGHSMREIHLVVYQPEGQKPQISKRKARNAMRELLALYPNITK